VTLITASGASRAEAFARAAEALLALIVAPATVTAIETREARAQGSSPEALLVSWLTECLYVHEIEGFAVARVEVDMDRDDLVHGVLHGEPLDAERHPLGTPIKAVSRDRAEVHENPGAVEVRAFVTY
jgi:SHS2 domain-containing protein